MHAQLKKYISSRLQPALVRIRETDPGIMSYIDWHYQLFTILPQVVARICHPNSTVHDLLTRIVVKAVHCFPQQGLWTVLAVVKSSNKERASRGYTCLKRITVSLRSVRGPNIRRRKKLIDSGIHEQTQSRISSRYSPNDQSRSKVLRGTSSALPGSCWRKSSQSQSCSQSRIQSQSGTMSTCGAISGYVNSKSTYQSRFGIFEGIQTVPQRPNDNRWYVYKSVLSNVILSINRSLLQLSLTKQRSYIQHNNRGKSVFGAQTGKFTMHCVNPKTTCVRISVWWSSITWSIDSWNGMSSQVNAGCVSEFFL